MCEHCFHHNTHRTYGGTSLTVLGMLHRHESYCRTSVLHNGLARCVPLQGCDDRLNRTAIACAPLVLRVVKGQVPESSTSSLLHFVLGGKLLHDCNDCLHCARCSSLCLVRRIAEDQRQHRLASPRLDERVFGVPLYDCHDYTHSVQRLRLPPSSEVHVDKRCQDRTTLGLHLGGVGKLTYGWDDLVHGHLRHRPHHFCGTAHHG
mmetsp:Transcript_16658/g.35268  ORF Transcript_16658/g.35268 Transcript_16658/m.35268 type:complete len:205 (+) Transcript_16658:698-1312(+)